jgi:hypothetical protein
MKPEREQSPWLGGPGARWAQAVLFVLHLALILALGVCLATFLRVLPRLGLEAWQKLAFFAGIALSLAFFGRRALRIGLDLWRAWRGGAEDGPPDPEDEAP